MRIVVSGYYGFGNVGDEAILEVLVNLMRDISPEVEIVVLSARAINTFSRFKIRAISRNDFSVIASEIRKADLFISGGGGLLQDVTSRRSLYYYLALIFLAQIFNVPTILLAQGIGPFISPLSLKLLSQVLKKVKAVSVRDKVSLELIRSLGFKDYLQLTADLAFLLKPDYDAGDEILDSTGIRSKPYIFLSPSKAVDKPVSIEALIQSVLYLKEEFGLEILVAPFYPRLDRKALNLIKERLKERAYYLENDCSPRVMLGIIGRAKLVMASRLHPLISAVVTGVPFIGLAYDPKLVNLVEEIGTGIILPMDKVNPADLIYEISRIMEESSSVKDKLSSALPPLMERAELNRDFLLKVISTKDL